MVWYAIVYALYGNHRKIAKLKEPRYQWRSVQNVHTKCAVECHASTVPLAVRFCLEYFSKSLNIFYVKNVRNNIRIPCTSCTNQML